MTGCSPLPLLPSPTLERLHFTRFRKTEFKLPEKYCFLQRFFVPLHQQSKESYFVPKVIYEDQDREQKMTGAGHQ